MFADAVCEVTVDEVFNCSCSRSNVIVPGPVKVTVVGLAEVWQVNPPEQAQPEKTYPEDRLQAVTVAEPKSVLKNEPPVSIPGVEQVPQFTDADEAGLMRTLTWAPYTAIRTPPELSAEQSTGLAISLEHATPSAQVQ